MIRQRNKCGLASLVLACSIATSWSQTPTPMPSCINNMWKVASPINSFDPGPFPAMVWTGNEMIVWRGGNPGRGAKYYPETDLWIPISSTNAPTTAGNAVWTGSEMIVWAGANSRRYSPATDSWATIPNGPAEGGTVVWTGSEMIVGRWGWKIQSRHEQLEPRQPCQLARCPNLAVWTGTEMIVWGSTQSKTGGRYNPTTDTWTLTSLVNAPTGRGYSSAIWTGTER